MEGEGGFILVDLIGPLRRAGALDLIGALRRAGALIREGGVPQIGALGGQTLVVGDWGARKRPQSPTADGLGNQGCLRALATHEPRLAYMNLTCIY